MKVRSYEQQLKRWIGLCTALLIALLAIIFFIATRTSHNDNRYEHRAESATRIHQIRIQRPDFADIVLDRTDDHWRISAPCHLPANTQRLAPLLGLVSPAAHGYAATEIDLDAAGLLQPLASITFDDQQIDIGSTDLSGERRYIRRGQRVEFVPEWILSLTNGGLSALAELRLFPETLASLTSLKGSEQRAVSQEQLAQWQALSARQIVPWPITADGQPIEPIASPSQWQAIHGEQPLSFEVYPFDTYVAVLTEQAQCALLVARSALPSSAQPPADH